MNQVTRERAHSRLSHHDLDKLVAAYFVPEQHSDIALLVEQEAIAANGYYRVFCLINV